MKRSDAIADLAELLRAWGKTDRARRIVRGLLTYDARCAKGWLVWAKLADEPATEFDALQRSVALDDSLLEAQYRLGLLFLRRGELDKATTAFESLPAGSRWRAKAALASRAGNRSNNY